MFACSSSQTAPAFAAHPPCLCHSPLFARLNAALTKKVLLQPVLAASNSGNEAGAIGSKKVTEPSAPSVPGAPVVFTNIRIFDGKSDKLRAGLSVRVEGKIIKALSLPSTPPSRGQ